MMKLLLAMASITGLFLVAACDDGGGAPPDGGAGAPMEQTDPAAPAAPAQ